MRYTISSVAILAASLLVNEVLAAPRQHVHKHKRDVVTENVVVTEMVTVTAQTDGSFETGLPIAVGTTTLNSVPIVVSSTPVATPVAPVSTSSASQGAVFIQQTEADSTPTTTSTPAPEPTTSVEPTTSAEPTTTSVPAIVSFLSSVISAVVPTTMATKTSSSAPVATASGKKRGLAYNDASLLSGFVSSDSKVSWCYNWASSTASTPSGIEYVPLLWGMSSAFTSVWADKAQAAIDSGSTHLMAFNEPDLAAQSNLAVSDAVSGYMTHMQPFAGKAKLGAPAVTNGGSPMGLTYLKSFMSGIEAQSGTVDFCSIHWYDSASNVDYFKSYMQDATEACGGKPIWVTEYGAAGSAAEQQTFLETVMPWMDEQDYIERYAYFMVTPGTLISSGTTLSALGSVFATFT